MAKHDAYQRELKTEMDRLEEKLKDKMEEEEKAMRDKIKKLTQQSAKSSTAIETMRQQVTNDNVEEENVFCKRFLDLNATSLVC